MPLATIEKEGKMKEESEAVKPGEKRKENHQQPRKRLKSEKEKLVNLELILLSD